MPDPGKIKIFDDELDRLDPVDAALLVRCILPVIQLKRDAYDMELAARTRQKNPAVLHEGDIGDIRKLRGYTQDDIAEKGKMTQSAVYQVEHGKDPRLSSVDRYMGAMEGSLRFLVEKGKNPAVTLSGLWLPFTAAAAKAEPPHAYDPAAYVRDDMKALFHGLPVDDMNSVLDILRVINADRTRMEKAWREIQEMEKTPFGEDPRTPRKNIRALREAQDMPRRKLARRAGISEETLRLLEEGQDVKMSTLRKCLAGLGYGLKVIAVFPDIAVMIRGMSVTPALKATVAMPDPVPLVVTPEMAALVDSRPAARPMTFSELRAYKGRSVKEVADDMNCSVRAVELFETMHGSPRLTKLGRFAAALGGKVRLIAEFPDRKPAAIGGLCAAFRPFSSLPQDMPALGALPKLKDEAGARYAPRVPQIPSHFPVKTIARLRGEQGYSQGALGRKIGVYGSSIRHLESMEQVPCLVTISRHLGGLGGTLTVVVDFPDGSSVTMHPDVIGDTRHRPRKGTLADKGQSMQKEEACKTSSSPTTNGSRRSM